VKQGKEVKLRTIVDDMDNYDVLFFGEEHNDSVTHFLEKNMLELLYMKFGKNLVLSMEMFERDVQPVMNEYLKGFIQEKHFKRDARVWGNYKDYRPLVEFAKDKGMDLICANAASRYTNLAGRKGQKALLELPDESKNFFAPLPYDTATGAYYEKLTGIPLHGPQTATDTQVAKMNAMMGMGGFSLVTAQSLWDATMAWSINEYRQKNKASRKKKIMEVNGRFHSDEGFGVVAQLKNYNRKTRILIISTACDTSFPVIDWKNYDHNGDYIMITDPKIPKTYSDGPPKMPEATKDLKKSKPHPARQVVKRKKKKKQV
jgi:uncharacterized iron-regulated protein